MSDIEVADAAREGGASWHVLWTKSHCEQLVYDQLAGKDFELFLPKVETWSRLAGTRYLSGAPLFPGYLFLRRHALDKTSYIEARKARGLVAILGERWDRLAVVPDDEIEAIRRLIAARIPALTFPYLQEGRRVRITRGPLAGLEGILTNVKIQKGLFVISVDLLRRSVAVEVDCTSVEPVRWSETDGTPGPVAGRFVASPVV